MADVEVPHANGTLATGVSDAATALEDMKLETEGDSTGDLLGLPKSAQDGVIKRPFAEPLEFTVPERPSLTTDQQSKYDLLLSHVVRWDVIPETSTKGSKMLPLSDRERMFLTRECLLRYLRATKWNAHEAETRLRATLIWRREYGVDKHTADYIGVEQTTGKQLILGWDNNGRPCHYMRPSRQNTARSDRQIQHLVYILERDIDLTPPGQESLTLIINFAETKTGQGASIGQGRQTLSILQNHYPERMGRSLVMNVPWFVSGFFRLITPFIDPVTREKIKFNEDPAGYVPPAQLLRESGGEVEFEYEHKSYWPALNRLCAQNRERMMERWVKGGKRVGEHENYLKGGEEKSLAETEAAAEEEAPRGNGGADDAARESVVGEEKA